MKEQPRCKSCYHLLAVHSLEQLRQCHYKQDRAVWEAIQQLIDESERRILESKLVREEGR